jgi:hypothetical protein
MKETARLINAAPAGAVLLFKVPDGYSYTYKSFIAGVRRHLTRAVRVKSMGGGVFRVVCG